MPKIQDILEDIEKEILAEELAKAMETRSMEKESEEKFNEEIAPWFEDIEDLRVEYHSILPLEDKTKKGFTSALIWEHPSDGDIHFFLTTDSDYLAVSGSLGYEIHKITEIFYHHRGNFRIWQLPVDNKKPDFESELAVFLNTQRKKILAYREERRLEYSQDMNTLSNDIRSLFATYPNEDSRMRSAISIVLSSIPKNEPDE